MTKKNKFYAVRKGRQTGVFTTWAECQAQIVSFKGADYISAETEADAWKYVNEGVKPTNTSSSSKKKKFYAVRVGRVPGVYTDWDKCKEQIVQFKGADYISAKTEEEAWKYINEGIKPEKDTSKGETVDVLAETERLSADPHSTVVYTDGSNTILDKDGNPLTGSRYSYGLVVVKNNEIYYEDSGEGTSLAASDMANVAGELLGAMKAVLYAINVEKSSVVYIIHDYTGVADWVTGAWNANQELTQKYVEFMRKCSNSIDIKFIKVAGHSKNKFNNRADDLSRIVLGLKPR